MSALEDKAKLPNLLVVETAALPQHQEAVLLNQGRCWHRDHHRCPSDLNIHLAWRQPSRFANGLRNDNSSGTIDGSNHATNSTMLWIARDPVPCLPLSPSIVTAKGLSFKQALNDSIRDGVQGTGEYVFRTPTVSGRYLVDITKANQLLAELDDAATIDKLGARR